MANCELLTSDLSRHRLDQLLVRSSDGGARPGPVNRGSWARHLALLCVQVLRLACHCLDRALVVVRKVV